MHILILFCIVLCGIAEGKWSSFNEITRSGSTISNQSVNINKVNMYNKDIISDQNYQSSDSKAGDKRSIDPEKEKLKNLILFLMANTKNRRSAPMSDNVAQFRPMLGFRLLPMVQPNIYEQAKCGASLNKEHQKCWCKESPNELPCESMTDCDILHTVTCGPTKPCPEHKFKWCFMKTPDPMEKEFGRTPPPCMNPTGFPVFCKTTAYTPCNTFTPPCVPHTKYTMEPCYCPSTCPTHSCDQPTPCAPCNLRFDNDLYSLLASRARSLPDDLRNDSMALLDRLIRKRSVVGPPSYRITKHKINS